MTSAALPSFLIAMACFLAWQGWEMVARLLEVEASRDHGRDRQSLACLVARRNLSFAQEGAGTFRGLTMLMVVLAVTVFVLPWALS